MCALAHTYIGQIGQGHRGIYLYACVKAGLTSTCVKAWLTLLGRTTSVCWCGCVAAPLGPEPALGACSNSHTLTEHVHHTHQVGSRYIHRCTHNPQHCITLSLSLATHHQLPSGALPCCAPGRLG